MEQRGLRTPAAAEYLGLKPATLEKYRIVGGGPDFVRIGRAVIYEREALDTWFSDRRGGQKDVA
jgi:predicted DNA-binding transcriptional regulator AlpA